MNKITVWERFYKPSKDGKSDAFYAHDHIEDGWNPNPKPISINQVTTNNWNGFDWRKTFAYLNEGVVINLEKKVLE